MLRRAVLIVVGTALIVDGLAGWSVNVVAVVVGIALVGGITLDGLAALMRGDRRT